MSSRYFQGYYNFAKRSYPITQLNEVIPKPKKRLTVVPRLHPVHFSFNQKKKTRNDSEFYSLQKNSKLVVMAKEIQANDKNKNVPPNIRCIVSDEERDQAAAGAGLGSSAFLKLKTPASPRPLAICSISPSFCFRSSTSFASSSSLCLIVCKSVIFLEKEQNKWWLSYICMSTNALRT